jgi:hypothetical protein
MTKNWLCDAGAFVGVVEIFAGCYMLAPWSAYVVTGSILLGLSLFGASR